MKSPAPPLAAALGAAALLGVLALLGGATLPAPLEAAAPAAPPFAPGATWTYRHTITKAGEAARTGTSRDVYRGQATYRGQRFHLVELTSTLVPGFVERTYLVWARTHFRQAANVATDAGGNTVQIIFDRPFGLAVQDSLSGTALVIQGGGPGAQVPWAYTAAARGVVDITVPAGTFRATRWEAVLRLGRLETYFVLHTAGITDIRQDSQERLGGTLAATTARELISGPVR